MNGSVLFLFCNKITSSFLGPLICAIISLFIYLRHTAKGKFDHGFLHDYFLDGFIIFTIAITVIWIIRRRQ